MLNAAAFTSVLSSLHYAQSSSEQHPVICTKWRVSCLLKMASQTLVLSLNFKEQ
uniref:Uncharacterized protein n=1 Tax=Tetranychus urticae TaxID=32264 RepID=T1KCR9_TETUR